jgi:hypothetical protein
VVVVVVLIQVIVLRLVDLLVVVLVLIPLIHRYLQLNQEQTLFMGQLIMVVQVELDLNQLHMLLAEVAVLVAMVHQIHHQVFLVMVVLVEQMYMHMDQQTQ